MRFQQLLFYKWYRVFEFFEDTESNCVSKAYFNTLGLFLINIITAQKLLEHYLNKSISNYYSIVLVLFIGIFLYHSLVFKNGFLAYKTAYQNRHKNRRLADTVFITLYCICS